MTLLYFPYVKTGINVYRWDGRDGAGFWDISPYDRLKCDDNGAWLENFC